MECGNWRNSKGVSKSGYSNGIPKGKKYENNQDRTYRNVGAPAGLINYSALAGIVPDVSVDGVNTSTPMARFLVWAVVCLVVICSMGVLAQSACYLIPLRKRDGKVVDPGKDECHARTVFRVIVAALTLIGLAVFVGMALVKLSYLLGV